MLVLAGRDVGQAADSGGRPTLATSCPGWNGSPRSVGCGMTTVWFILLTMAVFLAMEGVAWWTHRYVMHGALGWGWHRDHHEPHDKTFETNDLYGVVGAVIGTGL